MDFLEEELQPGHGNGVPGNRSAGPAEDQSADLGEKVFVHMYKLDSSEDAIYMFDLPDEAL